MEALGGARPNRAEDLEWLRELDRRLGEILERRAGGKLGPRAIRLPPVTTSAQATKAWDISDLQSLSLAKYRGT
jgi:hypothetical protein